MIRFEQVNKKYHDKNALVNTNFHLKRGDMAFLTGHSGAGKSTLLKLIMLMERPSSGKVIVDRQALANLSVHKFQHIDVKLVLCFKITSY